ncbi:hypothetical protein Esti_002401 [Eimeria stiedai]
MVTALPSGRDEAPILEALPSLISAHHLTQPRTSIEQLQQIHRNRSTLQDQHRQPMMASQASGQSDFMANALRSSAATNGTIVVGMLVQCEECGKKFINSFYLEKHMHKRHGGKANGEVNSFGSQNTFLSTFASKRLQPGTEIRRNAVSAPMLPLVEQQQRQQLLQQQQLLEQQKQLHQQQQLLQQQLSVLSEAALKAPEVPLATRASTQPKSTLVPLVRSSASVGTGIEGNRYSAAFLEDPKQSLVEAKLEGVQKEIQDAVKTLRNSFKDELLELQQQLNSIEPQQHRDTAAMLLNELKAPARQQKVLYSAHLTQCASGLSRLCQQHQMLNADKNDIIFADVIFCLVFACSESSRSSRSSRSSYCMSTCNNREKNAAWGGNRGGGTARCNTTWKGKSKYRHSNLQGINENRRAPGTSKSLSCTSSSKPRQSSGSPESVSVPPRRVDEPLAAEEETKATDKKTTLTHLFGTPQSAAATGPEAANEMRRAILCLLMYSHREFMARSQLPDVLRHNNKPSPDEVEKQLELPPGALSCQLANYLLQPTVAGQRSGVTTSNAPQNCDTLNVPWPASHGGGGCCYHLHKPTPPAKVFSVRAKLQQLKQRFSARSSIAAASSPSAQPPSSAAVNATHSPRQRWTPTAAQRPQQGLHGEQVAPATRRLNGVPLLMQHGGQSGGMPLPPIGVPKQPAHQLLPYTIDGGATTPKPRAQPIAVNTPTSTGPPRGHQAFPLTSLSHATLLQADYHKSTGNQHANSTSQWEASMQTREKSKSITEREVGAVLPALAWGGEEAFPSDKDLSLPEPKSPYSPPRGAATSGKAPLAFPPCSSWSPVEPPPAAPSIPLSVLRAAMSTSAKPLESNANTEVQPANRQLPEEIHALPASGQPTLIKSQQLMQQTASVSQQQPQQYYGGQLQPGPLPAAPSSEEVSGIHLKAPESAFGVFDGPVTPAGTQTQGAGSVSAGYLLSARGSRTLPGDVAWNTATYQPTSHLGPWQFAGLL